MSSVRCATHAEQRVLEREPTFARLFGRLVRMAREETRDVAVYLGALPTERGRRYGADASNGDTVWAIIRQGEVRTIMRRRSAQPSTPEALRVEAVYRSIAP